MTSPRADLEKLLKAAGHYRLGQAEAQDIIATGVVAVGQWE